jgi:type IV secretory pathway TrbF-like protein
MFGVRISSSTKCSNWPPKAQADTPTAPDPTRSLKVATLPYGHLIARERNWRIMAMVCAVASLLAIGGMIRLSTKSRIVPFVVAMDSLGRTVAAGPAEQASPSDDRIKRATLFTWVEDLRTVTSDGLN